MQQGDLFAQRQNLARVRDRIGPLVLAFCRARLAAGNATFRVAELHEHVRAALSVAPASADRILRDLRRAGSLDYRVLNRRESLYEILSVKED